MPRATCLASGLGHAHACGMHRPLELIMLPAELMQQRVVADKGSSAQQIGTPGANPFMHAVAQRQVSFMGPAGARATSAHPATDCTLEACSLQGVQQSAHLHKAVHEQGRGPVPKFWLLRQALLNGFAFAKKGLDALLQPRVDLADSVFWIRQQLPLPLLKLAIQPVQGWVGSVLGESGSKVMHVGLRRACTAGGRFGNDLNKADALMQNI